MADYVYTLLGDGASDRRLTHIIDWALGDRTSCIFESQWADLRGTGVRRLEDRVRVAVQRFPCDILFVHRDAESEPLDRRLQEILGAVDSHGVETWVPVIPIRMQEAWLLIDEQAIRAAAGNPNGQVPLSLPPLRNLESEADPKALLEGLLIEATELSARGRKRFRKNKLRSAVSLVARNIDDFSSLRHLSAFKFMDARLAEALKAIGAV